MKPPDACRFLCNKAYYFPPPVADTGSAEPDPRSTPFWCGRTHDPVGPDGGDVGADCCKPDRSCYKPEVDL